MKVARAPVALTSDGDVVLNLTAMDVPARAIALAEALRTIEGTVFVGVCLPAREARLLVRDLGLVLPNVTDPAAMRRRRAR
jgi:hypothetical protein